MTTLPDWSALKLQKTIEKDIRVWKSSSAPHRLYYTSDSLDVTRKSTLTQKKLEYSYARGQRLRHPNILVPHKLAKEHRKDLTRCYMQLDPAPEAINRFNLEKTDAFRFLSADENVREMSWVYHLMLALAYLHDREYAHNDLSLSSIIVAGTYAFLPTLHEATSFLFLPRQKYGYIEEMDVRLSNLPFRPPEAILNLQRKESADPRKNDIWACGVLVYWIATGEMPFGSTEQETLAVYSDWSRYSFEVVAKVIEHKIAELHVSEDVKNFLYQALTFRPASRASIRDLLAEDLFAEVEPLARSQPDTSFSVLPFLTKLPAAPSLSPEATLRLLNQVTGYNISVTAGLAAQLLARVESSLPLTEEATLAANIIAAEFTQSLRDLEGVQFALERLSITDPRKKEAVETTREEIMKVLRYDIWYAFPEIYLGQLESGEEQGRIANLIVLRRLIATAHSQKPHEEYEAALAGAPDTTKLRLSSHDGKQAVEQLASVL